VSPNASRAGSTTSGCTDLRHLLLAERAPITYVADQLGHANASTTLRYYARWIPSKGQRWADLLDRAATTVRDTVTSAAEGLAGAVGSILGTKSKSGSRLSPNSPI
jgi:hypothetical protein